MFTRRQQLTAFAFVLVAWIALCLVGTTVYSPPTPRSAGAPETEFSAERARSILKELVGDGIPHPTESKQNAVVRERILRYFREFGYEPEIQTSTVPGAHNALPVRNILVRRRGSRPGPAIMLVAHYDSVRRGPGASDDGAGVAAVLEIARMMSRLPPNRNDMIFLITDAEEDNLLGARAFVGEDPFFVEAHPWAGEVKVAINLEARGTSGPSLMFQTSDEDAWLIRLYARHVTRPATSSLYYEVYKRLPNDTDFTVFKKYGMEGYNFAFVRNVRNYHTGNDTYENADPGSLQHHGDNAWQLLTALADLDLTERPAGRAIYTDVLGQFTLWWPASINLGLAIGITVATLLVAALARWRRGYPSLDWRVMIAVPLLIAIAVPACWLAERLPQIRQAIEQGWIDRPLPVLLLYWLLTALIVVAGIRYTPLGRIDGWSAWLGTWLFWDVLGLVTGWFVPGISYLFILPCVVAALTGLVAALWPRTSGSYALLASCCLGAIGAGVLWLPMQILLYDGVGLALWPVYPLSAYLLTITALPLYCAEPLLRKSVLRPDANQAGD
jgi:hypothetical protein